MGPIVYSLCQKPVIGLAMFSATFCDFPPLVQRAPISLEAQGETVVRTFSVPVDKSYEFDLEFEFPSREAIHEDQVVGTSYNEYCEGNIYHKDIPTAPRENLGRAIPIQVLVRNKVDGRIVFNQTFHSLCMFASGGKSFVKWRKIGRVPLARGEYDFEVKNMVAQTGLVGVHTYISVVSGRGK